MELRDYRIKFERRDGDVIEGDVRGVPGVGAALREFLHARSMQGIDGRLVSCDPIGDPAAVLIGGYAADHRQEDVRLPSEQDPLPVPDDQPTAEAAPAVATKPASGQTTEKPAATRRGRQAAAPQPTAPAAAEQQAAATDVATTKPADADPGVATEPAPDGSN